MNLQINSMSLVVLTVHLEVPHFPVLLQFIKIPLKIDKKTLDR